MSVAPIILMIFYRDRVRLLLKKSFKPRYARCSIICSSLFIVAVKAWGMCTPKTYQDLPHWTVSNEMNRGQYSSADIEYFLYAKFNATRRKNGRV